MKLFSTIIVLSFLCFSSYAQILNPGFENWANGNPSDWFTNNIPGLWIPVTQSNTANSGSSAVKGTVTPYANSAIAPLLMSGATGEGFTITAAPTALKGYYQWHPQGNDKFIMTVSVAQGNTIIGVGGIEIFAAATTYTQFIAPIEYVVVATPDRLGITFSAGPDQGEPNPGAYFLFDDLELSFDPVGVNDISLPLEFKLSQNYPNPFNPSTKIEFQIPSEGFVTLKVYDILGNEVASLIEEYKPAGSYRVDFNASGLSGGIYFYRITAGADQITHKMTILK
jgi:hypothetical protein